jgi:hypothetical protein
MDLLNQYQMDACRPVATPMDPNQVLNKNDGPKSTEQDQRKYASVVGSLLYLANTTRPDIAYGVSVLSQFISDPSDDHWRATKRLLRYLKSSIHIGLMFKKSQPNVTGYASAVAGKQVTGYTDADFAACVSRRSRTGYIFFVGETVVCWCSRKQNVIALSTCEAEYYALTEGGKEAIHLSRLWWEFKNQRSYGDYSEPDPVTLLCDNQSAMAVTKNPAEHKVMKHVDLRHKWIMERVANGEFKVDYVQTSSQVADIFTKALPRPQFENLRAKCGLVELPQVNNSAASRM